MQAVSQSQKRVLSKSTRIRSLEVGQTSGEVTADQGAQLRIRFKLVGGLVDAFSRDVWQTAYDVHDTSLRLLYRVKVMRKGGLLGSQVAEPARYLKKATLYWTRNPDLTDNITNRIWVMVIDEEKVPHVFDTEKDVRESLFSFDRRLLVPATALPKKGEKVVVEVKMKWGRHSFIEKGTTTSVSAPFSFER
jgi:hypothetical protein